MAQLVWVEGGLGYSTVFAHFPPVETGETWTECTILGSWVSGDGAEFVVYYHHIPTYDYQPPDRYAIVAYDRSGAVAWTHEVGSPGIGSHRRAGYPVGAPRAGRYLWVNTAEDDFEVVSEGAVTYVSGDLDGSVSTADFADVEDLSGETVLSREWRVVLSWSSGFVGTTPAGDSISVNSDDISPIIRISPYDNLGHAEGPASDIGSGDVAGVPVVTTSYASAGTWTPGTVNYVATIDNTANAGPLLELRDETGATLSVAEHVEDPELTRWVGTTGSATYFVGTGKFSGDTVILVYRRIEVGGDSISWAYPEQDLSVTWEGPALPVLGAWGDQVALAYEPSTVPGE